MSYSDYNRTHKIMRSIVDCWSDDCSALADGKNVRYTQFEYLCLKLSFLQSGSLTNGQTDLYYPSTHT